MKNHILSLMIIFSALLFFSGCYTVIWMPEDEFPSEIVYEGYYSEMYYGDYYSFYNYPWWSGFAPSITPNGKGYIRNENETTMSLRNEGQGRGTDNGRKIPQTDPPRRDVSNDNSSSNSTSSNSSWSNHSSSESSNNSSSSSRSSDNSSMRNDTGSRNSNSGRR
jgi:hypothetical protein